MMMTLRRSIALERQTARKPNGAVSKVNREWEREQARERGAGVGLGVKREHFLKDVCYPTMFICQWEGSG